MSTFNKVIQNGQPDQIMNMFLDPRYARLVGALPHRTFVRLFLLLSPAYFVLPYRDIHWSLHPSTVRAKRYKSLSLMFDELAQKITGIVQIRQSADNPLCLAEYKHLLDWARSMGDRPMAEFVWAALQADLDVSPDLQCYNYYLETIIWSGCYTGVERYRNYVTGRKYWQRARREPGYTNYGTWSSSLRLEVLDIFSEMTSAGITGDEATFVNVLLATARVGYIDGVMDLLRTVWNIHVQALCNNDPSLPPVTPLDRLSPIYPTDRLLFAVAHAFGTNSNFPAAMRLVDFISRSYDVPVPEYVWLELCQRGFIQTRFKTMRRCRGPRQDEIEPDLLLQTCAAMMSAPHNVMPTIDVYRIMAKTIWDWNHQAHFRQLLVAAYRLVKEAIRKRKEARLFLVGYLDRIARQTAGTTIDYEMLHSREFADAVRTYDIHRLRAAQHIMVMERLVRLLVIRRWRYDDWELRGLPLALEEWQDFLPEHFDIHVPAGQVKFTGRSGWSQQYLNTHGMVPRRRRTPAVEPDFEEEEPEIDEDFFWVKYRKSSPLGQVNHFLLNRVFWEVRPGDDYFVREGEAVHWMFTRRPGMTDDEYLRRQLGIRVSRFRVGRHRNRLYRPRRLDRDETNGPPK